MAYAIFEMPDDAEYNAMLHYVTSDEDGNLEANDAISITDLKALQVEVEGYRALIADAITIRLDVKGRFDVMSGTYPDSGLKYWLETRTGTVHKTALEAYAALKPKDVGAVEGDKNDERK